jgi:hypothetical protein
VQANSIAVALQAHLVEEVGIQVKMLQLKVLQLEWLQSSLPGKN